MDAGERAAAIEKFNDPKSDVDVLVTSFATSSFGLNLQTCCSNLIIMAVAQNVNIILQVIGRIHRLGQSRVQNVWIITMARSYDNILQFDQTNKMIAQLAGEADVQIDEAETDGGELSDLDDVADKRKGKQIRGQCQEMIRRLLGQRVSRGDEVWGDRKNLEGPWRVASSDDSDDDPPGDSARDPSRESSVPSPTPPRPAEKTPKPRGAGASKKPGSGAVSGAQQASSPGTPSSRPASDGTSGGTSARRATRSSGRNVARPNYREA